MTSVYKMTREQLIRELESFPMEVIGNINDLRESVKLGREIVNMCSKVPTVFTVSVLDCGEYKVFGTYSNESDAEAAIDTDIKNECLNSDCAPGDDDYDEMYQDFRNCFKIEIA